ncbi:MAG: PEP-CTERM sorting domain-containing protein, partial [Phycisphaerae bacterium]
AGVTWTAPSSSSYGFSDSGYGLTTVESDAVNAYLPFTPVAGQIYTLSAGLDLTSAGSNPNNYPAGDFWMGLGFLSSPSVSGGGWVNSGAAASPWVLSGYQGANNAVFTGPGTTGGQGFGTGTTSGVNDYSIVLNTGSSLWSYQVYLTNSAYTNLLVGSSASNPFSSNPTSITAVGFEDGMALAQVSDFSLTDVAVPEPATLGLIGFGALGLLLLKRRKSV